MSESETTTTNTATTVPSSSVQEQAPVPPVTREELVELIQAIRFAKPEVSQRQVHREITQDLSRKEGFQFLEQVEFKHIQKAWKQAVKEQPNSSSSGITTGTSHAKAQQQPQQNNADLLQKLQSQSQPPELFTIGHNQNHHSIQFLAQEYTAAQKLAEHTSSTTTGEDDGTSIYNNQNYVHVFLDVPHDKTGSRPHEALIHFQKPTTTTPANTTTTTAKTGNAKSTNKKKSHSKKSKDMASSSPSSLLDDQGRMIVKIQRAAPRDAMDTTQHPLLLYNQTRTCKTFIHPDEGYDRIVAWMDKEGQTGVLGITGGAKAYFYARLTLQQKGQPNILSIDVTQLAPPQEW